MLVNKKIYNPLYFQLSGNASDTFFLESFHTGSYILSLLYILLEWKWQEEIINIQMPEKLKILKSGFQIFENNVRKDHLNIAKEIFQHLI